MKLFVLGLASLLVSPHAPTQAPTPLRLPASDEAAIRQVVQGFNASHTARQFQDMATYATTDLSLVTVVGQWYRGRAQVQAAFQTSFDHLPPTMTFTPGPVVMRAVTSDVVIANQVYYVSDHAGAIRTSQGASQRGPSQNIVTMVLVKRQGRWLLTAGQGTTVDATLAADNPALAKAK